MKYKALLIISILFLLSACSKPIDESKVDYVGAWNGPEMTLTISQNGNIKYKRVKGKVSTSLDAPLQEFTNDGFIVGIAFFTTTFIVSEKPHRVDGQWQMMVDDVLLTRKADW